MKLKSLELLGFKSFCERTKIDFTDGITALVGPNGCGKTNIVEAVRWVLGELSPSLLRCEKMEDVIFSGASDKKALGVAEVTLIISNDDGEIPLDYSEVAITRRLYRSGESEYYINKNLCRLKDIHNLLLNTGVSHRTYSVFENAMIDRILSRDSTYKRLFFEEASKIAKYRERKNEALRKLEATETDIGNLQEVIAEAERYTSSLKRQANKARRYSELREKLSYMKASALKEHYAELKESIASNSKKFEQIKTEKSKLLEALDRNDQEIEELGSKSDLIEGSIEELECQLKAMDNSINTLEKDIVSYKERIKAERENLRRGKKELDSMMKLRQKASNSINSNQAKLNELKEEVEMIKDRLIEMEQKLTAMAEDNLVDTKDRLYERERKISKKVLELETALKNRKARIRSIESELKNASQHRENTLQAIENLKKSISELFSGEKELNRRIEKLEERKERVKKEIVQIERQLSKISAQLEAEISSPLFSIQSTHSILKDYLSIHTRYEKAIMGALGVRLMAPVVRNDDLPNIVKSLRAQKASRNVLLRPKTQSPIYPELPEGPGVIGRATDFVETQEEVKRVFEWLLFDYVVVSDLTVALKFSEIYPNLNFSTLTGDVLQSDGTVWTGLFKEEQRGALDDLRKTHASLNDEFLKIESELRSESKEYSNLQLSRARLEAERDRLLQESKKLEGQISALEYRFKNEEKEVDSLQKSLRKEKRQLSQLMEEIRNMETSLSTAGKDRETLITDRNELLIKLRVSEERMGTISNEIERDKTVLEETEGSIKNLEEELKNGTASVDGLEASLKEKFDQLESLINKRNNILERKSDSENEKTNLGERMEYLRERRKLIQTDLDRLNETMHQTELKLMELTRERSSLRDRTAEEFGIDLEQFEPEGTPDLQEIQKLENALQRIGIINPLAAEEYERERERLDFLRSQLNDLLLAKKYLLDTIALIDERATSQFKLTFKNVRNKFKAVFSKFFDGGVADLRLENDGDTFNSSIELVANPKGKKLKTLDSLSGGERTLVAIAFLFALYLCRPSPFCILDEIDATLDDANVARFLAFLKELSTNTQFLIVTHNKRTMESANSLYGITMEEPGVSKVVSVKLKGE